MILTLDKAADGGYQIKSSDGSASPIFYTKQKGVKHWVSFMRNESGSKELLPILQGLLSIEEMPIFEKETNIEQGAEEYFIGRTKSWIRNLERIILLNEKPFSEFPVFILCESCGRHGTIFLKKEGGVVQRTAIDIRCKEDAISLAHTCFTRGIIDENGKNKILTEIEETNDSEFPKEYTPGVILGNLTNAFEKGLENEYRCLPREVSISISVID